MKGINLLLRAAFLSWLLVNLSNAIPTISPSGTEVTFSEKDAVLVCNDDADISWIFSPHFDEETPVDLDVHTVEVDGRFISTLNVNVSHENVGYYYCVSKVHLAELSEDWSILSASLRELFERKIAARIYVYLDFESAQLHVLEDLAFIGTDGVPLWIPCLPTRKDIAVAIQRNGIELDLEFDPKEGFKLNMSSSDDAGEFECTFNHSVPVPMFVQYVSSSTYPDRPTITASNHDQFVHVSERIELSCATNDIHALSWNLPGKRVKKLETHYIGGAKIKKLIVENLTMADSGTYECVETNLRNWTSSNRIKITVLAQSCHINIWEANAVHTITVDRGAEKAVYVVKFDGYPKPLHAEWIQKRTNLTVANLADKYEVTTHELGHRVGQTVFTILNPQLDDAGTYILRVFNNATADCQQSDELHVNVKEKITKVIY